MSSRPVYLIYLQSLAMRLYDRSMPGAALCLNMPIHGVSAPLCRRATQPYSEMNFS